MQIDVFGVALLQPPQWLPTIIMSVCQLSGAALPAALCC